MSLSFVSSAVQIGTSDGGFEETPIENKETEAVNRRNAHKPLFEQLRSNQEEDQEKKDELQRQIMRSTCALDEDDVAHLDSIERQRSDRQRMIQERTETELENFRAARALKQQAALAGINGDDNDNDDNNNNNNNKRFNQSQRPITEEELQQKLPDSIRPPFSNIFPIYRHNKSSSEGTVAKQDSSCLSKPEQTPLIPMTSLPLLAAQLYYWSPFTALPACLYSCWQNVPTLFLVASIYESVRYSSSDGSLSMSSFYLAAAAYLEPHHIVYALPIVLVLLSVVGTGFTGQQQQPGLGLTNVRPIAFFVLCFGVWSVLLQGVSCSLVGPSNYWKVAGSIYGNTWLTTSPNLSLQWYFRMQVFARFRDYFGAIFALVPYVLMGPIGLRFQRYPEVQFAMWTMVWTIYRPVQVLFDMNVALCFFLFSPRSLARMGYASVIALCCIPVPLFLNIVDHWMWLDANNGNANYIFFQCLAHNVFLGIILGQFASASMKRDKALRLTYQKEVSEETKETKKGSN